MAYKTIRQSPVLVGADRVSGVNPNGGGFAPGLELNHRNASQRIISDILRFISPSLRSHRKQWNQISVDHVMID